MKLLTWVRFIFLSIFLFVLVMVIIYWGQIWNAIKVFPIDWVISFLLGAAMMFLATFGYKRQRRNSVHHTDDNSQ